MVAASDRSLALLDGMSDEVLWRTSILGMHASVAAFTSGDDWLDGTIAAIEESKRLLDELLTAELPDVGFRPPDATYLAWLDFRRMGWEDDPSLRALDARVALNPGPEFGNEGRGFARLNFACSAGVLTEAVRRLKTQATEHHQTALVTGAPSSPEFSRVSA